LTEDEYIQCNGCNRLVKSAGFGNPKAPDNGWHLPVKIFGYYSGFTDDVLDVKETIWDSALVICHDCVVKMLSALPNKNMVEKGGHTQVHFADDKPCCDWAWKLDGSVCYFADEGKWYPSPGQPGIDQFPE
jgi:predicted nucleic acid-binding Zn ribbon protein